MLLEQIHSKIILNRFIYLYIFSEERFVIKDKPTVQSIEHTV